MPLLLPFRRAGVHERVAQALLYPAVALAGLAILVPFAMILALSFGDVADWYAGRKWPDLRHFVRLDRLYVRYLALRYDYWPSLYGFNDLYGTDLTDVDTILVLPRAPEPEGNWRAQAADALECLRTLPWTHVRPLFTGWWQYRGGSGHDLAAFTGLEDEAWRDWLRARHGTIARVNAAYGTAFLNFRYVKVPALPEFHEAGAYVESDPWAAAYIEYLAEAADRARCLPVLGDRRWREWLAERAGAGRDLAALNARLGTAYAAWSAVRLPAAAPPGGPLREAWEAYVRGVVSPRYLRLEATPALEEAWRRFAASRGADFGPLPASADPTRGAAAFAAWIEFARGAPLDTIRLDTAETRWRAFLARKYGTPDRLAAAWERPVASFADAPWPAPAVDRFDWERRRWTYVKEIVLKNYRRAWQLMVSATPAAVNTARFALLFTLLSVAAAVPAAWALSRFGGTALQGLLVLFLALAAFPIEAMAVPSFVLLREMGLLNTVWALVLPTALNGYWIFLIKGHFDSLPRAYLEEAAMEGATEWQLFSRVAVPMAAPMIAVVALYSFLWSYANFMWALIVCQQPGQWTLPVLLFNMSTWAATPLLAAAVVLVLVPPLIVFAFAHRTLQRALMLPRL